MPMPSKSDAAEPSISVVMMLYRRIGNLDRSLEILSRQTYRGSLQLLLWNNNYSAATEVDSIVNKHRHRLAIEVIHSHKNYHCLARQSIAVLATGDLVMMIDDDIIPNVTYLSHFVAAFKELTRVSSAPLAICACGHRFSPAVVGATAREVWEGRRGLTFYDETHPQTEIHFMHANNCLLPRDLLLKVAANPPPETEFGLVDDYWMSYVLSDRIGARLVKIEAASALRFGPDAFDPEIAMFNRKDVHEARLKLFSHHASCGWPHFGEADGA